MIVNVIITTDDLYANTQFLIDYLCNLMKLRH